MAEQLINLRALRNEREWLPRTLDDAIGIRRTLLDNGVPAERTAGIVSWLIAKAAGETDVTSGLTRARYRKVLAELQSPLLVQADAIPR